MGDDAVAEIQFRKPMQNIFTRLVINKAEMGGEREAEEDCERETGLWNSSRDKKSHVLQHWSEKSGKM